MQTIFLCQLYQKKRGVLTSPHIDFIKFSRAFNARSDNFSLRNFFGTRFSNGGKSPKVTFIG